MPVDTVAQHASPCPWLKEIMFKKDPNLALRVSLKAFALTRLGWIYKDDALSTLGRAQYGLALKHVQSAIWDPSAVWSDDTLAASHTLSIYEVRF